MTKCKDLLSTQTEKSAQYLEDIESNFGKFDEMVKDMTEDPVKAIAFHESYKSYIVEAKEQLVSGLRSLAQDVESLTEQFRCRADSDEAGNTSDEDVYLPSEAVYGNDAREGDELASGEERGTNVCTVFQETKRTSTCTMRNCFISFELCANF